MFRRLPAPLELEEEVRRLWEDREVFARSLTKDAPKGNWVFYEGPPTANGTPHNGHVLTRVMKVEKVAAQFPARATYHDSCSGLRELGVKAQPRALLAGIEELSIVELAGPETCCGFGGLFCVKYPPISAKMVDAKADDVLATGADLVLGGDMGCLMNIAGRLQRRGATVQVRHVAEVLAGTCADTPAIGEKG